MPRLWAWRYPASAAITSVGGAMLFGNEGKFGPPSTIHVWVGSKDESSSEFRVTGP